MSFSLYGVTSAQVRVMRYVLMLAGSASDATASTSMCLRSSARAARDYLVHSIGCPYFIKLTMLESYDPKMPYNTPYHVQNGINDTNRHYHVILNPIKHP